MNLILLTNSDFRDESRATLNGRRARHVLDVHRARVGQVLRVGLLGGLLGMGRVARLGHDEIELDEIRLEEAPPDPLPLSLILALPRPKVLRRVIEAVAALGIKELFLVNAARVEKSYFDSPRLAAEEVRDALLRGLEQGRDTILPRVEIRDRFRPFVEDEVPARFADARRLVAHPGVRDHLPSIFRAGGSPDGAPARSVIALGPEGGFVPFEIERLLAQGFQPFHLGARVLRVETAVSFAAGQLCALIHAQRCAARAIAAITSREGDRAGASSQMPPT